MIDPCKECVFCGRLSERNQTYCAAEDDPCAAVKACITAYTQGGCDNRMTRGDVQEMRQKVVAIEIRRENDRGALLKCERLIYDALELIGKMRSETVGGKIDAAKV